MKKGTTVRFKERVVQSTAGWRQREPDAKREARMRGWRGVVVAVRDAGILKVRTTSRTPLYTRTQDPLQSGFVFVAESSVEAVGTTHRAARSEKKSSRSKPRAATASLRQAIRRDA